MANLQHVDMIKQGSAIWNVWIKAHPELQPDLRGADLSGIDLKGAYLCIANLISSNLSGANLRDADLSGANLSRANLQNADLRGANFQAANLSNADLANVDARKSSFDRSDLSNANLLKSRLNRASFTETKLNGALLDGAQLNSANLSSAQLNGACLKGANLTGANLLGAHLHKTNFYQANLTNTNLMEAYLMSTNFTQANLNNSRVYGCVIKDLQLIGATQFNLSLSAYNQPNVIVDHFASAQFVSLFLNNQEIRTIIHAITTRFVLIVGRFSSVRQDILDALRDEIRQRNYIPIMLTDEESDGNNFKEILIILTHLARFVLADITGFSSLFQDLQTIFPNAHIPLQIIQVKGEETKIVDSTTSLEFPVHFYNDRLDVLQYLQNIAPIE